MEIHEILDRFEIMYPSKQLSDLRRAYIDREISSLCNIYNNSELKKAILIKDLRSIFNLAQTDMISGSIDDLKKCIFEEDYYSIFRLLIDDEKLYKAVMFHDWYAILDLIGNKDLKEFIMHDNYWSMFSLINEITGSLLIDGIKDFFLNNEEFQKDCLSRGQIKSKLWLVNELKKLDLDLGTIFLCAGWYGLHASLIYENQLRFDKIRSFDIDSTTEKIADTFNKKLVMDGWKFKAAIGDIHEIDWKNHTYKVFKADGSTEMLTDTPDTIINTSCEHIENFSHWYDSIPVNKLIILQSNNYFDINEHINCSENLKSFSESTPMSKVLFEGELPMDKYTRFMKIGYK